MSQSDGLHNNKRGMRYFTPELFLNLNSPDSQTVDSAMTQWEKAVVSYKRSLQKLRDEMPSELQSIAELSLHDWNLLDIAPGPATAGLAGTVPSAFIVLKQHKNLIVLCYSLNEKLQVIDAPKEWSLSKKRVQWLYDELDADANDQGSLIHRILFSDGATVIVPFSSCRVVRVKSDHAMSHSDLMQIA